RGKLVTGVQTCALPIYEAQQQEFERLTTSEPYTGVQAMRATWFEQGEAKGMERGQRKILAILLERQFGPLSPKVRERLESLSGRSEERRVGKEGRWWRE